MSSRSLWIALAVLISTLVYFTIRYGLRPKPIPVINPTAFVKLEQMGNMIYKRLRENLRSERVVVLGLSGQITDESRVWRGLLEAASADKKRIILFQRADEMSLKEAGNWSVVDFSKLSVESKEFADQVKEATRSGAFVVILVGTEEASHLMSHSVSEQLEKSVIKHSLLSISTLPFVLDKDSREELETRCDEAKEKRAENQKLVCAQWKVARKFLRKNFDMQQIWGVMERHGLKEFVAFIHLPREAPPAAPTN